MKLDLPKQVLEVMDKLDEYGYSAYIHGECVRMLIGGQTLHRELTLFDFDLMTNAELPRIRAVFEDYNVIEDNLDRGELVVKVLGIAINITSYINLEYSLVEKYAFTFDAFAYSNKKGFFDPFDGLSALENGEIRWLCWTNSKHQIFKRAELEKILLCRNIKEILSEYRDIFIEVIPEFRMLMSTLPSLSDLDLLAHSFKAVGISSPILTLRYALLFYELGKSDCHSHNPQNTDKSDCFYGHAERAAIYAYRIMTSLECLPEIIEETCDIIRNYQKVLDITEENLQDLRDEYPVLLKLLLLFNCADARARGEEKQGMKFKKLSKLIN